MSTTIEKIQRQIAENPILLYMKGSPKLPSCGFSAQAVQALAACGERFAYVDILQNPDIRAELPEYFADLQAFYDNAAEQGNAVLVMID